MAREGKYLIGLMDYKYGYYLTETKSKTHIAGLQCHAIQNTSK